MDREEGSQASFSGESDLIEMAFRDAPYGLVLYDASSRVLACNKAAERILGVSSADAMGRDVYDPEWRSVRVDGSPLPIDEHPVVVCLKSRTSVQNAITGIWNPAEGRPRWLRLDVVPRFRGGGEEILGAIMWIADITQEFETSREERRSRSLFHSLFDHMSEGVALHEIVLDDTGHPSDYRIVDVNPRFEHHVGIPRNSVIGRLASEAYGTSPPPYLAEYSGVAMSGEPHRFETYFPPLDKHFLISAAPLGPGGFATIFFDISETKRAQEEREQLVAELERKNKELESIVYVASHDLRSPLLNIQGFGARLERDCGELAAAFSAALGGDSDAAARAQSLCNERIPRSLDFIRSGAQKIDRLIAGLLRLSRVGRASLVRREIDMGAMLAEILKAMSYQVETSGAKITIGDLPPCSGDADQLSQVFSNLLDNAVKYRATDRPLVVTVTGRRNGSTSEYVVEDNGRGIEADRVDQVWDLFCRLEPDDGIEGEGLGLTLARRIVERHGGCIRLESEYGKGSRFIVSLPGKEVPHGRRDR
jgi:PAS domain S-box-containing protein